MAVYHVLEVLRQAKVEWVQVHLPMDNLEQSVVLIDCQVFNDGL